MMLPKKLTRGPALLRAVINGLMDRIVERTPEAGWGMLMQSTPSGCRLSVNLDDIKEVISAAAADSGAGTGTGSGGGISSGAYPVTGGVGGAPDGSSGSGGLPGQTEGAVDAGPTEPEEGVFEAAPVVTPSGRAMALVTFPVCWTDPATGVQSKRMMTVYGTVFDAPTA